MKLLEHVGRLAQIVTLFLNSWTIGCRLKKGLVSFTVPFSTSKIGVRIRLIASHETPKKLLDVDGFNLRNIVKLDKWDNFPQAGMKIRNHWNHRLVFLSLCLVATFLGCLLQAGETWRSLVWMEVHPAMENGKTMSQWKHPKCRDFMISIYFIIISSTSHKFPATNWVVSFTSELRRFRFVPL